MAGLVWLSGQARGLGGFVHRGLKPRSQGKFVGVGQGPLPREEGKQFLQEPRRLKPDPTRMSRVKIHSHEVSQAEAHSCNP